MHACTAAASAPALARSNRSLGFCRLRVHRWHRACARDIGTGGGLGGRFCALFTSMGMSCGVGEEEEWERVSSRKGGIAGFGFSDSRLAGYRTVVMAKYSGSTPGGHFDAFVPFVSSPPPLFLPHFLAISRGLTGRRARRPLLDETTFPLGTRRR